MLRRTTTRVISRTLRLMTLPAVLLTLLGGCAALPALDSRDFDARSYQLYYGNDSAELQRLSASLGDHEVLILDSRKIAPASLQAMLQRARDKQARVLGYLSIGELDSRERARFDAFVATLPVDQQQPFEQLVVEWNDKFASWRIDVSAPLWQRWLQHQAEQLAAQGLHGLFLDTPDTVDRYLTHPNWSREQRIEKTRAMIDLIRAFKQQRPQDFIVLNRGLNLIGEAVWLNDDGSDTIAGLALMQPHPDNPDAVLYENAYASDDPWTQRIEADLRATAAAGRTQVFTLGYRDTIGDAARFFARNNSDGFIGSFAASSTSLHQTGTEPAVR
ncbi:hypothetical protein HPT27_16015 [Permianibacter sp. IMCC34836]|uniref:endo alpha-1,4 polygalactosaminidase n=1 Tax=Permianibacter fluminis TaxID=2738515 RepID=UPI00155657F1|nr:endo alpha-1,4 polygalactosaminidase [Permianibacter fluminis]NQD38529.1 hypothetical protein [Permianibacter fluminis]